MSSTVAKIDFFDPHFHIWDVTEATPSGHDASILFEPGGDPIYTATKYEADFAELPTNFVHIGGVFVEAMSVCHVDTPGTDTKFTEACAKEAEWVAKELAGSANKKYALCTSVALENQDVGSILDGLIQKYSNFCGVRQICNFEPSWPRNGKELGNPLCNEQWIKGLALLAEKDLSFDAQLNPSQFAQFADIMEHHPDLTVIINHCGTPTMKDITENKSVYFKGLERLSKFPNVYMQLSMLVYTDPKFDENETVIAAVRKVIDIFGAGRCFFASNYPVDIKDGWPAKKLFPALLKLVEHLDDRAVAGMFSTNALKAYCDRSK